MGQVIHIFRKDARHLWPRILVVWSLVALHAFQEVGISHIPGDSILTVFNIAPPLSIAFLIGWLVFEEALPGDRQFWLTRPYRWPELLAAKVLFIVAFISVPLFLSDCYILGGQRLPVLAVFPELLVRQLLMTVLFILPSFAIATLAAGVSQFLLGWFVLSLAPLFESLFEPLWIRGRQTSFSAMAGPEFLVVLAVTACGIIFWQYVGRRTTAARIALLAVTCAFFPAFSGVSHLNRSRDGALRAAQLPNRSGVSLAYDPDRRIPSPTADAILPQGSYYVQIPLKVAGLPPKTLLRGSGEVVFDFDGTAWPRPGYHVPGAVKKINGQYCLTTSVEQAGLPIVTRRPVNIHATLGLEVVTDKVAATVPVSTPRFPIPSLGTCRAYYDRVQANLSCVAGLAPTLEMDVRFDSQGVPGGMIATFAPRQIPWGLSPVSELGTTTTFHTPPGAEYVFIPRRKIAQFGMVLDLNHIHLWDDTLPRPGRE